MDIETNQSQTEKGRVCKNGECQKDFLPVAVSGTFDEIPLLQPYFDWCFSVCKPIWQPKFAVIKQTVIK